MNMDDFADAYEHRHASQELSETPWWQALMADSRFHAAYDRNSRARLLMSDSTYVKRLLRSETARQGFIEQVLHPEPEHLMNPDEA